MATIKPRTLSGFMELLPQQQVYFDSMVRTLKNSFSLYGFTALDLPLMEAAEILLAKGGGETEKQVYTLKKGDTDLAIRYDLTTSLAKYTAMNYSSLTFPFRRYEIGKVYRGERAQRGRFREFYQADIDIIGDGSLDILNDAEIPSVIYNCLSALGLEHFVIHINNRKVLSGFFAILGVEKASPEIMRIIDKLAKIGVKKTKDLLVNEATLSAHAADEIINLISCESDPITYIEAYRNKNELFDEGADELAAVARYMSDFGVPECSYKIDLSIARGLDYYTGTIYETLMTYHPEVGSICSGGRYDNLAEYYTDKKLPGVGISIGLTRLFSILTEQKMLNPAVKADPADILILPMTDDLNHSISLATSMREQGLRVQIYSENKKFKHKISYADKLNIPYVIFLGEDEIKGGTITVKDMQSGEQTTASPAIITAGLAERILVNKNNKPIFDSANK